VVKSNGKEGRKGERGEEKEMVILGVDRVEGGGVHDLDKSKVCIIV